MTPQELCEKATPGPWEVKTPGSNLVQTGQGGVVAEACLEMTDTEQKDLSQKNIDALFIAMARTKLPSVLEKLDTAEKIAKRFLSLGRRCNCDSKSGCAEARLFNCVEQWLAICKDDKVFFHGHPILTELELLKIDFPYSSEDQ